MNLQKIMQMQQKMARMQDELKNSEFTGESGNGVVSIKVSGEGRAKEVKIDESLLNTDDKEMLEDLLMMAFNNAKDKIDSATNESMKSNFGGLKMPF